VGQHAVRAMYRGLAIGQPGGFGGQDATFLEPSFTNNVSSYLAVSVATAKVHGLQRAPTGGGPILVGTWLE
jgi:hypothetical protein